MTKMMSENLPKTGYSQETPKNFLLNAGALVSDLKWDKVENKWSYELIGATSGGSKITLRNNLRQVEVDGVLSTLVGGDMIESTEAIFEVNLIEHTLDNLKRAIMANVSNADGTNYPSGYDVLKPKMAIEATDYVTNLAYIGTLNGNDKPVIIIMHHAICTSGYEVEAKDKAEGVYTVVYQGRTSADKVDDSALPITVLFPKDTQAQGWAAAASTQVDGGPEVKENEQGDTK